PAPAATARRRRGPDARARTRREAPRRTRARRRPARGRRCGTRLPGAGRGRGGRARRRAPAPPPCGSSPSRPAERAGWRDPRGSVAARTPDPRSPAPPDRRRAGGRRPARRGRWRSAGRGGRCSPCAHRSGSRVRGHARAPPDCFRAARRGAPQHAARAPEPSGGRLIAWPRAGGAGTSRATGRAAAVLRAPRAAWHTGAMAIDWSRVRFTEHMTEAAAVVGECHVVLDFGPAASVAYEVEVYESLKGAAGERYFALGTNRDDPH